MDSTDGSGRRPVSPVSTASRDSLGDKYDTHFSNAQHFENAARGKDTVSTNRVKDFGTDPGGHEGGGKRSTWQVWYLEGLSSFLALASLISMVAVLVVYQDDTLPYRIPINALIAVFTTIFKASLILPIAEGIGQLKWTWFSEPRRLVDIKLFDDASRGPRGSFLLLLKQFASRDRAYLATFGALLTVAAIAIDPFSQAIVEHKMCSQNIPVQSRPAQTIETPRTNNYTGTLGSAKYKKDFAQSALDLSMPAALYKGLVDPQSTASLINFGCPSGNCAFTGGDYFNTLEMCHSCEDISSQIANKTTRDDKRFSLGDLEVTMENILSVKTTNGSTDLKEPFFSLDMLMIRYTDACRQRECSNMYPTTTEPFAARCRLDPCVRTHRGRVVDGVYYETSEGEPKLLQKEDFEPNVDRRQVAYSLVLDSTIVRGKVQRCNPSSKASSTHSVPARPDGRSVGRPKTWENSSEWPLYPRECVYVMEMTPYYGISGILHDLLAQNITAVEKVAEVPSFFGPVWLQTMYQMGNASLANADAMMDGLASSISATMRNRPGETPREQEGLVAESLRSVAGSAFSPTAEVCVHIHWGWIAYPAALFVLQQVFVALVLGQKWRGGGEARGRWCADWKTSPLALLFHGLDERKRKGCGDLTSAKSMNEAAGRIHVELSPAGDSAERGGWRFR